MRIPAFPERSRAGQAGAVVADRRRLPTGARVALGLVAAAAAVGGGVLVGLATDEDRGGTTQRATTSTAPVAGAATTTLPALGAGGPLADGFYVIVASEALASTSAPDAVAALQPVADGIEGATVVSTSDYTHLPSGDPRIGQPPFYLPAEAVAVVAVGPFPLDHAVREVCPVQFDGDCLVRQLTTAPLLDPGPGGLAIGDPDGFEWPHPDHPAFPFPSPAEVKGGVEDEERCAGDDRDDDEDDDDEAGTGCLTSYAFTVDVADEAVTTDDVVTHLERFAPATGWAVSDAPALAEDALRSFAFDHSCGGGCHALVHVDVLEPDRDERGPRLEVVVTFDDH